MTADQWLSHLIWVLRDTDHESRLLMIALRLADYDTATESLIAHGYGTDGDSLLDMVAFVVEAREQAKDGN